MKTYSFFNVKGGVGKSTSAITIAHLLATEHNKRVLLVDLDPQGNTSDLFCEDKAETISNLLTDSAYDVSKVIHKTMYNNLDIIPAAIGLAEIEERMKADIRTPQQFRLKAHLAAIHDDYDYCILDCSPSISIININGLAMTDYVFMPLKADRWAIDGSQVASNLIATVKTYNPNLNLGACFFTQFEARTRVGKEIHAGLSQIIGNRLLDIQIRKSVKVQEMTYERRALADYAPHAGATEDYRRLTDLLVSRF